MTNAEKQTQIQAFKDLLNALVPKMDQNEIDMGNSVAMTDEPYILRQELTLLSRNIFIFSAAELPGLTKVQRDTGLTHSKDEFKIAGVAIPQADGHTLALLRGELEDVLESTKERFNQHLINLRPGYYPNRPQPINA